MATFASGSWRARPRWDGAHWFRYARIAIGTREPAFEFCKRIENFAHLKASISAEIAGRYEDLRFNKTFYCPIRGPIPAL